VLIYTLRMTKYDQIEYLGMIKLFYNFLRRSKMKVSDGLFEIILKDFIKYYRLRKDINTPDSDQKLAHKIEEFLCGITTNMQISRK